MSLRFAVESGWYWAFTQRSPQEIAWIIKGDKCLVKLVDGKIDDIEPNLDGFDMNIIRTIMSVNLGYQQ